MGNEPDWNAASERLRDARKRYCEREKLRNEELNEILGKYCDCSESTLKRDMKGKFIPEHRVEKYAEWFCEEVDISRQEILDWLMVTAHSQPEKCLAKIFSEKVRSRVVLTKESFEGLRKEEKLSKSYLKSLEPLRNERFFDKKILLTAIKEQIVKEQIDQELFERNEYEEITLKHVKTDETSVSQTIPSIGEGFLGREEELEILKQWADEVDEEKCSIARLQGFPGNGKSTIQKWVGKKFIYHSIKSLLNNPFDDSVWISAEKVFSLADVLKVIVDEFDLKIPSDNAEDIKLKAETHLKKYRILVLLDNFQKISNNENQNKIFDFFNNLKGISRTLISTNSELQWFKLIDTSEIIKYPLIPVKGLSSEETKCLINAYIEKHGKLKDKVEEQQIDRMMRVTDNNPQIITMMLVLRAQGMPLVDQLDRIKDGGGAEKILKTIFGKALEEALFSESNKAILATKALFNYSVRKKDLGDIAGVNEKQLTAAIDNFQAISFFEIKRSAYGSSCISSVHSFIQYVAQFILRSCPQQFREELEARWWDKYAPAVAQRAGNFVFKSQAPKLQTQLEQDIRNVIEHVEEHLKNPDSPYRKHAANLVGGYGQLGHSLRYWGKWDDIKSLAELAWEVSVDKNEPQPDLIIDCGLRLLSRGHRERKEEENFRFYVDKAQDVHAILDDDNSDDMLRLQAYIEGSEAGRLRYKGSFPAAKKRYNAALDFFKKSRKSKNYDFADVYIWLSVITMEYAAQKKELDGPTDRDGIIKSELREAEDYLNEAMNWVEKGLKDDWEMQYRRTSVYIDKGMIARIKGELEEARKYFRLCDGRFPSLKSTARWHIEMALVEYVAGREQQARTYAEKGRKLQEDIGIRNCLPPYHAYKMLDQIEEGWKVNAEHMK